MYCFQNARGFLYASSHRDCWAWRCHALRLRRNSALYALPFVAYSAVPGVKCFSEARAILHSSAYHFCCTFGQACLLRRPKTAIAAFLIPRNLLATNPHLGQVISINTGQTASPDLGICPTGMFTIAPVGRSIDPKTRQPSPMIQGDKSSAPSCKSGCLCLHCSQFYANHGLDATPVRHEFAAALAKLFHR